MYRAIQDGIIFSDESAEILTQRLIDRFGVKADGMRIWEEAGYVEIRPVKGGFIPVEEYDD